MSNELGNKLYDLTIKQIIKSCTNKEQKVLADYILEKALSTQIYNVTDVLIKHVKETGDTDADNIYDWINIKTGIKVDAGEKRGIARVHYSWTPYSDDMFTYAETNNGMWYICLMHRLDDEKVVMFFGTVNDVFKFTIFESITVKLSAFYMDIDYSHMFDSVDLYIKDNDVRSAQRKEYLINSMDICFIGYFVMLLKMFNDITTKDSKSFKCYIDEDNNKNSVYYRSPLNKRVTKITNKPIVLVLTDSKDVEEKAKKYKRRNGNIRYAFSWVVRGHYRKLHNPKSIGMDRNGKRCMPGVTWIETYMKGDETFLPVKREHIVIDKRDKIC